MTLSKRVCTLIVGAQLFFSGGALASENPEFDAYVSALRQEAIDKGFSVDLVERAFATVTFRKKAVKADKNQPEVKLTLDRYLSTRVPDWKVKQAIARSREHTELLQKVASTYGVQPRFIVALWGNESNFGRIQGSFPVVSALVTLAFDGRREALFKKQLFAALQILEEGHVSVDKFTGSWAGAMGQSQFMPTSFLAYAVDFDGDGRKDIWQSEADVFASIANYLSSEGWDDSMTWGRQVVLVDGVPSEDTGLGKDKMRLLQEWQALGVRRFDGSALPTRNIRASLIMPDGPQGRIYLVYNNFHTLMRWNRSTYFGTAVGYLSERIRKGH